MYGETIKKFELFHHHLTSGKPAQSTSLYEVREYHKHERVWDDSLKSTPIWEMLFEDEGRRREFRVLSPLLSTYRLPSQERCQPHLQSLEGVELQTPEDHDRSKSPFHFTE